MTDSKLNSLKQNVLNLEISVDEIIDLKVLIVIAPRIEQRLCHLDPTHVTDELQDGEDRNVDVRRVILEGV